MGEAEQDIRMVKYGEEIKPIEVVRMNDRNSRIWIWNWKDGEIELDYLSSKKFDWGISQGGRLEIVVN